MMSVVQFKKSVMLTKWRGQTKWGKASFSYVDKVYTANGILQVHDKDSMLKSVPTLVFISQILVILTLKPLILVAPNPIT